MGNFGHDLDDDVGTEGNKSTYLRPSRNKSSQEFNKSMIEPRAADKSKKKQSSRKNVPGIPKKAPSRNKENNIKTNS